MNDFANSQIPSEIACLNKLQSLDLSSSSFSGQIPSEISHLVHLSSLHLSWNPLLKLPSHSFENLVQNLTKLEELHLSGIDISSPVPSLLANFSFLRSIHLEDCQLQDEFPVAILHLPQLQFLSIARNPNLLGSLHAFHNNTLLEHLDLCSTGFSGIIPETIGYLNHLVYFSITDNYFFGHIPSSFTNLTRLRVIDVGRNQLQGEISTSFSNFRCLQYLGLDHNNFTGRVYLDTFAGLNKLDTLYLSYNRISFFANNYTDRTLPQLKNLGLSSCNLKEFPAFLRLQNKMTGLFLYQNKLEGLVPEWIWNNSRETLHLIGLSNNLITGFHGHPKFLPWLRLQSFEMAYNMLQGQPPVPSRTTIVYDVSNNNLTGEVPILLCEVKSLQVLDLSSNYMSGTLPTCLTNISLLVLNLKRNKFHGPIMDTFSYGNPLKRIDLSENCLTGEVPRSLAKCTTLEFLSLGDNFLEDVFPYWLNNVKVLILRSNKFFGPVTFSSQFHKLRIIDLSNNSFSGHLPANFFQRWNAMKSVYVGKSSTMGIDIPFNQLVPFDYPYSMTITNKGVKRDYQKILNIFTSIDLSCNNFEGQIPQSLHNLHGLESLNLSNNHLTGGVSSSFGDLTNLESLDLSRNELSGELPQALSHLTFLGIFNVSFNHFDGRIPQGQQLDTFDNSSYMGNPRLCGQPLSKECHSLKTLLAFEQTRDGCKSLLPSDTVDWIVVFVGVGNGLIIAKLLLNFLNARHTRRDLSC